jgi:hypothetical protein
MPAANNILSISLYVYNLVQSFILAWYMSACMPNIHYAKSYVFAYVNCCIYYNARISMPVDMLSSVYLLICQMLGVPTYIETTTAICCIKCTIYFDHMLYVICRLSYAKAYMPVFVCWVPYASQLLWVCYRTSLYAYLSTSLCMLYHRSHMPVTVYLHLYAGTWVPSLFYKSPS